MSQGNPPSEHFCINIYNTTITYNSFTNRVQKTETRKTLLIILISSIDRPPTHNLQFALISISIQQTNQQEKSYMKETKQKVKFVKSTIVLVISLKSCILRYTFWFLSGNKSSSSSSSSSQTNAERTPAVHHLTLWLCEGAQMIRGVLGKT